MVHGKGVEQCGVTKVGWGRVGVARVGGAVWGEVQSSVGWGRWGGQCVVGGVGRAERCGHTWCLGEVWCGWAGKRSQVLIPENEAKQQLNIYKKNTLFLDATRSDAYVLMNCACARMRVADADCVDRVDDNCARGQCWQDFGRFQCGIQQPAGFLCEDGYEGFLCERGASGSFHIGDARSFL